MHFFPSMLMGQANRGIVVDVNGRPHCRSFTAHSGRFLPRLGPFVMHERPLFMANSFRGSTIQAGVRPPSSRRPVAPQHERLPASAPKINKIINDFNGLIVVNRETMGSSAFFAVELFAAHH